VVIVDHGPDFTPMDYWKQFHPNTISAQNYSNPGFAAGCNHGAKIALAKGGENLWFLNNDTTLDEPILGKLVELACSFPSVALWGTYQFDGKKKIGCGTQAKWFAKNSAKKTMTDFHIDSSVAPVEIKLLNPRQNLCGMSIFLTSSAWEKIGPWPEKFFLYREDDAWCLKAHLLGLPIAIVDLTVSHVGCASTTMHSPLHTFYRVRNRLLLHSEVAPKAHMQRLFLKFYILQQFFFRMKFKCLKPTWDAIIAASKLEYGRDPRY
jgi:GT2 family glycosyltransferase